MALIDEVNIKVHAGAGGNGCSSFRRETFVPRGGPNGGNGGDGGSVYLVATHNKASLLDFKYRPKFEAERGEHGMGSDCYGRGGADLEILVPVGTIVYRADSGEKLHDLVENNQRVCVAQGGKGGIGNMNFKTATNRAPRTATPGQPGESIELKLELRLIADVGLIGLPNAGKSSFLRVVSRARPKVADYPFTTLEPHLGVVDHKNTSFVVADLPGLIEGASEGAGLGYQFLRHVSRNRILLHLVDISQEVEEIQKAVEVIREELGEYDPELLEREEFLVLTKADLYPQEQLASRVEALRQAGLDGFVISSHSGYGMGPLLDAITRRLNALNISAAIHPKTENSVSNSPIESTH